MKNKSRGITHKIATRREWLAAQLEVLQAEKEHTWRGDELALMRQELPWVLVDKEYRFETEEGAVSLSDLFQGRSQLLVYHFMFGPNYTAGCPSCSAIADGFNGFQIHLANHDVMLWAVSRAPLAILQAYKRRMVWTFPWASSFGGDFNVDYSVGFSEEHQRRASSPASCFTLMVALPRRSRSSRWPSKASSGDQGVGGAAIPCVLKRFPSRSSSPLQPA